MDLLANEPVQTLKTNRWDLIAFSGAFVIGLVIYMVLRTALYASGMSSGLIQIIVTLAIAAVMIGYAVVVVCIPRLRVRLDQAGDNAYYLGLLFTLISMAMALWEFGSIINSGEIGTVQESGARKIIANFGVALASTIMGIFLRVILHQMRVDPADVEGMTRIELAEASTRVRASLDSISHDMGRFYDEVKQRTADTITTITEDTVKTTQNLMNNVQATSKQMLDDTQKAQGQILAQTQMLLGVLSGTANEAAQAMERLRTVEPPPLLLAKRLGKITDLLATMGEHTTDLTEKLAGTASNAEAVTSRINDSAERLDTLITNLAASQANNATTLEHSVRQVSSALTEVGQQLSKEGNLLIELQNHSRQSAADAALAQQGAVEVLKRLNEVTRQLVSVLQEPSEVATDAATR
jgi:hypothetical protein